MSGGIVGLLLTAIQVYVYLIIARVLLSWLPVPRNQYLRSAYSFIFTVTEPYLALFRRILPRIGMGSVGLDFSPFIGIVVLILVQSLLRNAL